MFILPEQARIVRRISGSIDSISADEVLEDWFPANLAPPEDASPLVTPDASPRDTSPWRLQFGASTLYPGSAAPRQAGERVQLLSTTYELLGRPRQISTGRRVLGHEVGVLSVQDLYPYVATLQQHDLSEIVAEMPLAVWQLTENISQRSGYEEFEAEAPIEYVKDLSPNKILSVWGSRHHITRAYVPPSGPRVRMTLRRRDRNG